MVLVDLEAGCCTAGGLAFCLAQEIALSVDARAYIQLLFEESQEALSASKGAGEAGADVDDIGGRFLGMVHDIEGGHLIGMLLMRFEFLGDKLHALWGEPAFQGLKEAQGGQHGRAFSVTGIMEEKFGDTLVELSVFFLGEQGIRHGCELRR